MQLAIVQVMFVVDQQIDNLRHKHINLELKIRQNYLPFKLHFKGI
jgi:hypothetical protein